jgi:16S rRNA (cytidine1402-2'-O)-methyltransferase
MQKGKLYLIPVTLGNYDLEQSLPRSVFDIINKIDIYIVENIKSAEGFLKKAGIKKSVNDLIFQELNVNTKDKDIINYLDDALNGKDIGLLSEAGVPCVADPGAAIVLMAHQNNIQVVPLAGPSSVILALMASGLNGQNFSFNGYLPIEKSARAKKLKKLEKKIKSENQTQIFIEAPHRNDKLVEDLVSNCDKDLRLCIGKNLTMDDEFISTQKLTYWSKSNIKLGKNPVIFLLGR